MNPTGTEEWERSLGRCFSGGSKPVHLIGVGNPIGRDDSVGLNVISSLRRRYGARPSASVRIHQPVIDPERSIARLGGRGETIVIFDAVECNKEPGHMFFAKLTETKFGFFATHNIPLKLIPGVEAGLAEAWVAGIQPADTGVGEELTEKVKLSAALLVETVGRLVEASTRGAA